jgi:hypothetical protein
MAIVSHRVGALSELPLLELDDGEQLRPLLLPVPTLALTWQERGKEGHYALYLGAMNNMTRR